MTSRVGALAATTVLLLLLLAWLGPGLAAPSPQRSASGWPGLWGILRDIRDVRHVRDTSRSDAADRPDRDQGPAARAHTSALGHVTRRVSDRVASMFRSVRSTLLHITSTGRTTETAATQPPQPTSDLETGASSDILSKEAADKREPEDAPTTAAARHQQQEEGQQQQQQSFVSSALERVRDAGRTFSEMGLAVGRWGKAMAEGVVGSTVNSAVGTVLQVFKGGKQDDNADHVCYPDLGCFSLREPWSSSKRPLPRMNAPESVRTQFFLHTRNTSSPDDPLALAVLNDTVTNAEALLRGARSFFIVHGFNDKTTNAWMQEFKDVLLETVDANVVLVDWAPGAQASRNYLQAASNTRIVGAELARLLEMLSKMGALSLDSVHVIGHSLGAHAAGYAGKQLSGRLARVTGLDAAQPAFEDQSAEVRIASGDAVFVDVVHTNGAPFIPTLGLGVMQPVGDADFYLNGGTVQPGCFVPKLPAVHSLMDLAALPVSVLGDMLSCSHRRAIEYFMEAVRGKCRMWGQRRGEATTPVSGDKATQSSISRRQAPWWSPSRALGGLLPSVWGDSASPAGSRASGWPARGFSLSSLFSNFFSAPKSKDEGPVEDNAIADVTQPESDYPVSSPSDTADRVSPAPPPLARNKRPVHLPPPPPWCEGECIPLGLDTHLYGIRGTFDVQTADRPPYCVNQESNEIE